ncbi:MAG: sensor domain-containing diguanylate cyclase [Pseudomonadota bacterium]
MADLMMLALDQTFIGIVITDADLDNGPRIIWANQRFREMTGYALGELQRATPRILQGPLTNRDLLRDLSDTLRRGEVFEGETVNYRKDGSAYNVEWTISPVLDANDEPAWFVSFQRETTNEWRERQQRRLQSTALEQTADSVLITDPEGIIQYVNNAFEVHTGYSREEALGARPNLVRSGCHDEAFYRELWATIKEGRAFRATFTNRKKNGELYYEEKSITPVHGDDGAIISFVSTGKDVTERVEMEKQLERLAVTDSLTGLPNRLRFEQLLESEVERSGRYGHPLALIMLDIDHFKSINDIHGHDAGDDILCAFADEVSAHIRQSDTLARWGGEEFMLLAPETDYADALALAEKIRQRLEEKTFSIDEPVTASFGVAVLHPDEKPKQLVKRADLALYRAKEQGRNRVVSAKGQRA